MRVEVPRSERDVGPGARLVDVMLDPKTTATTASIVSNDYVVKHVFTTYWSSSGDRTAALARSLSVGGGGGGKRTTTRRTTLAGREADADRTGTTVVLVMDKWPTDARARSLFSDDDDDKPENKASRTVNYFLVVTNDRVTEQSTQPSPPPPPESSSITLSAVATGNRSTRDRFTLTVIVLCLIVSCCVA